MSWWPHDDDPVADEEISRKPSPADAAEQRLRQLKQAAKDDELARQLTKDQGSRRKGKGDGR